jgi:hypothetical protein
VRTARGAARGKDNKLASGVQSVVWLSLIPGWAGFAALEPELGVEHKGGPTGPPIFLCIGCLDAYRLQVDCPSFSPVM